MNAKLVMWPASIVGIAPALRGGALSVMLVAALGCTSTEDNPGTSGLGATVTPPAMPLGGGAAPGPGGTAAPPTVTAGTAAPDPTMTPMAGTGAGAGGTPAQQADAGTMMPEPTEGEDPRGKCNINS